MHWTDPFSIIPTASSALAHKKAPFSDIAKVRIEPLTILPSVAFAVSVNRHTDGSSLEMRPRNTAVCRVQRTRRSKALTFRVPTLTVPLRSSSDKLNCSAISLVVEVARPG
jgi:hypothetical protein